MKALKKNNDRHPSPKQVIAARKKIQRRLVSLDDKTRDKKDKGITDAQDWCAQSVHTSRRAWQQWETEGPGGRKIHLSFFELATIKIDTHFANPTLGPALLTLKTLNGKYPSFAQVVLARKKIQRRLVSLASKARTKNDKGITDTQDWCADSVHTSRRAWQQWESEGAGGRKMHPAFWELFNIKLVIYMDKPTHIRS